MSRWIQYASEGNFGIGVFEFSATGDTITVQRGTTSGSSGRCYHSWNNTWKILSCSKPITYGLVDELAEAGMFPSGQVSNAELQGMDTIHYWGECDSGD
jgi:hypothetical protein